MSTATAIATGGGAMRRQNFVFPSEGLAAPWAQPGSPTRVAAADSVSGVSLDLLGDDDAVNTEGFSRAFTGFVTGVKHLSAFMRAGTAGTTYIRIIDNTAATMRVEAAITWTAGVPSVAMAVGTLLRTENRGGGRYRFVFRTATAVVSGNSNSVVIFPAGNVGASTGTTYVGGVMVADADSAYTRTVTEAVPG
jgi:hypothetical protein